MKTIMTAQQAFNLSMNEYPALYARSSLEEAQMKYYDHVFNVIGNGYDNIKEFKNKHKITSKNSLFTESFPEKYITGKPLFWAYTEVDESHGFKRGKENSSLPGVYSQEELKNMPEVVYTVQSNKKSMGEDYKFNPYPNFKKEYSLVWDDDISKLDKSWHEAALMFYRQCQDYFDSDKVSNYHYACPKDSEIAKWQKNIEEFEKKFTSYQTDGISQNEYYQKISQAYEVEYMGDTKDFIKRRWEKERSRINEFLTETIDRLECVLTPQIKTKKKAI